MLQFSPKNIALKELRDHIIYDEAGLLAINKPAGLVSMGGEKGEFTLASALEDLATDEYPEKVRLCHRLDRFTSGVLLMARTKSIARCLNNTFRKRAVTKKYWALTDGIPSHDFGVIDSPIATEGMFPEISDHGKSARTDYNVLATNEHGVGFVSMKPRTGRRHQLRLHAAAVLGTPLLGDQDYHPYYHLRTRLSVDRAFNACALPEEINVRMNGQMLHARSVTFVHPGLDEEITIKAPLPEDRAEIWTDLGFEEFAA